MAKNKQTETSKTTQPNLETSKDETGKFEMPPEGSLGHFLIMTMEELNVNLQKQQEALNYLMEQDKLPASSVNGTDQPRIQPGTGNLILQGLKILADTVKAAVAAPAKEAENEFMQKARASYLDRLTRLEAKDTIEMDMLELKRDTAKAYVTKKIEEGADLEGIF